MTNWKHVLAMSGLVLSGCALWTHFVIYQGEFYRFSDEEQSRVLTEFAFWQIPEWQRPVITAGPIELYVPYNEIKISYLDTMRENASHIVMVSYDRRAKRIQLPDTENPTVYQDPDVLPNTTGQPLKVKLTSAAFEIRPATAIEKKKGTDLPTQFRWTITPKREGNHFLTFHLNELIIPRKPPFSDPEFSYPDIASICPPPSGSLKTLHDGSIYYPYPYNYCHLLNDPPFSLSVNGKQEDPANWEEALLPVTVVTYLGISRACLFYLTTSGGVIGFLLTVPILRDIVQWIRSR